MNSLCLLDHLFCCGERMRCVLQLVMVGVVGEALRQVVAKPRLTRVVKEATSVEEVLEAMGRVGEDDDGDVRRLALSSAFQKLAQRCVGSGAVDLRRKVVDDARFAKGLELLEEESFSERRLETLRFAAVLTTQEPCVALEATLRVLERCHTQRPSEITTARWIGERCGLFLTSEKEDLLEELRKKEEALKLPFSVMPGLLRDLEDMSVESLALSLPFGSDFVVTKSGQKVQERRLTAWVTQPDVGAIAYSGKMMPPISPLPMPVKSVSDLLFEKLPPGSPRYDCALLNLYPDGGAACRYHSDPEHGTYWHRNQAVVSFGEPRRFAFRLSDKPTDDLNRHVFHLFHGDVVHMTSQCQDIYQHAVFQAEDPTNAGPRISYVLKHALLQTNGKKGHGTSRKKKASSASLEGNSSKPPPAARKRRRRKTTAPVLEKKRPGTSVAAAANKKRGSTKS